MRQKKETLSQCSTCHEQNLRIFNICVMTRVPEQHNLERCLMVSPLPHTLPLSIPIFCFYLFYLFFLIDGINQYIELSDRSLLALPSGTDLQKDVVNDAQAHP